MSAIAPAARIGHPAQGAITLRQNTLLKQNSDISQTCLVGARDHRPSLRLLPPRPRRPHLHRHAGRRRAGRARRRAGMRDRARRHADQRRSARRREPSHRRHQRHFDGRDRRRDARRRRRDASRDVGPGATYPYPAEVAGAPARRRRRPAARRRGRWRTSSATSPTRMSAAVERFLAENAIARASVALVGLHGQTVLHRPHKPLHAPTLRRRARGGQARARRRLRFPLRRRRGGRRGRAAGPALSRRASRRGSNGR